MTYGDLLKVLRGFSPAQLKGEVIVTVGNDQDELSLVEGIQFLESENMAEDMDLEMGNPLLRIT